MMLNIVLLITTLFGIVTRAVRATYGFAVFAWFLIKLHSLDFFLTVRMARAEGITIFLICTS